MELFDGDAELVDTDNVAATGGSVSLVEFDDGAIVVVEPSMGPRLLDESATFETCDLQQRCGRV